MAVFLSLVRVRRGASGVEFLQFELQRALGDDPLAGFDAFQDGDPPAVLVTEFYFAPLELFAREQDVDNLFAFVVQHRFARHHHRFDGLARVEPHVGLHPDAQCPALIGDGKNDMSGARLFFYDPADVNERAVKFLAGECHRREARLAVRLDQRQVALEDRRLDPDRVEVGDLQNRLARSDPLADALADLGDQAADRRSHGIGAVGAADAGLRHVAGGFERRDARLSRFRRGLRGPQLGFSRFQLPLRISLLLVETPRPLGFAARQVESRAGRVRISRGGPPFGFDPGGLDPGLRLSRAHLGLFGGRGGLLQRGDDLPLRYALPDARNVPAEDDSSDGRRDDRLVIGRWNHAARCGDLAATCFWAAARATPPWLRLPKGN